MNTIAAGLPSRKGS